MVKLIKADLRKDRAILLVFLLIIILSTLLMHTGLLASNYKELYDRQAKATNTADYVIFSTGEKNDLDEFFDSRNYIKDYSSSDIILMTSLKVSTSGNIKEKNTFDWIFQNYADDNAFSELNFIERDDNVKGDKIYLNLYFAYSSGLCTGDKITVDSPFGRYDFTVAGIYQHLYMGGSYTYQSAMVAPEIFEKMKSARDAANEQVLRSICNIHINEGENAKECLRDSKDSIVKELGIFCEGITAEEEKGYYTAVVNILAAFMAVFAVIIMVICLIIIIFTINNNISRDVRNIGALKAVGHTVAQIRTALAAEYVLLGIMGSVIGVSLSYALYPVLEYLYIREITGLIWENRFFGGISFGVVFGVLGVIVITAFLSTVKIRSLHPATALRFGLQSNSFKKNHLPLAETKGGLDILLALKSTLQNKAQNIIVFCIILAVAFVTMFSEVLYYNTKVDISNFQRMIQGDVADAHFYVENISSEAVNDTISKLRTVEGVSRAYGLSMSYCYIDDIETNLIYCTDPQSLNCIIYDGEMLKEDNEAVLGISLAEEIGAGVGDEVEVSFGNESRRFLVTGLQQSAMNDRIYVHENAAKALGVPVYYDYIRVGVENADNEKVDEVLRKGKEVCGGAVTEADNNYRYQHSEDNTPVFAVGLIVMILVVLNIATILLVITLLLKTIFVKREKEFGIKKAVGFTSTQLRYQLSLSLLPTTLLASAAGAIVGYFGINPLFALVLGGYGIKNSDLMISSALIALPVIAVTALVFIFSFIMSVRMKKLSAYKLIQE